MKLDSLLILWTLILMKDGKIFYAIMPDIPPGGKTTIK